MQRSFTVRALWDDDAKVFYSESDIIGLHIEAPTIEAFLEVMNDCAPELIVENHIPKPDLVSKPLRELIPAIVFCPPDANHSAA